MCTSFIQNQNTVMRKIEWGVWTDDRTHTDERLLLDLYSTYTNFLRIQDICTTLNLFQWFKIQITILISTINNRKCGQMHVIQIISYTSKITKIIRFQSKNVKCSVQKWIPVVTGRKIDAASKARIPFYTRILMRTYE